MYSQILLDELLFVDKIRTIAFYGLKWFTTYGYHGLLQWFIICGYYGLLQRIIMCGYYGLLQRIIMCGYYG